MTTVIKDWSGKIVAYCEWWVTNGDDRFGGEYIFVREIWILPCHREKRLINEIIQKISEHEFSKPCKYVYWNRAGHYRRGEWVEDRVTKPYRIETVIKRGNDNGRRKITDTTKSIGCGYSSREVAGK